MPRGTALYAAVGSVPRLERSERSSVYFYWAVPVSEIVTGDARLVASVVICMLICER
jgi:hypothetical protein